MDKKNFKIKIKTSIVVVFSAIILFIVGTMMFFQYKSSNEFAILTTQKIFDRISDKVINKIQMYDTQSIGFVELAQTINHSDDLPQVYKQHTLLPLITKYIKRANYVYGIYIGFKNNNFYIVYNLDLSHKMREAQHAPQKARWLIKKNILNKDGKFISYKEFVDENFITISKTEEVTKYLPTQRPWYKDAIHSQAIIKTAPYIFSSVQEPGVTYAKRINKQSGTVLALDITLSSLSNLLASQKLVDGSASFIFKKDGKIIGQADNISNKTIININKQYPNAFIKDGNVIDLEKQKIITINGVKYLKYTTMLKSNFNSKDYFTILSPIDVIMKPYKDKIYQTLLITLMTLLFIVLPILVYAIRLIVKPIIQLQKENKKVKDGKFEDVQQVNSFMIEIVSLSKSLVLMSKSIEESQRTLEIKIQERTADLEETKKEVEAIHKHTRDSIEYASLIQGALIPHKDAMVPYFKDHFVTWTPKDTVGGDIWLFNDLRHEDECMLMFIDCTGHGVPGAFVTMIVKAVEREIISLIKSDKNMEVSPGWVMGYFNRTIKKLLRQETKDSLSNAGWDGGIIYYNRRTQVLKFAGAETPLFYMTKDGEFKTIKGNRYSVGYKKCDMDYEYKETIIDVEEGMKFYCTTDGYLDQNGGEKDFPFGKKRFGNIIKEYHNELMAELEAILQIEMTQYEDMIPNNDRNDDMTVIGFEIGAKSDFIEDTILEIVKYEGVMTQNVIASCMDNIEARIKNINLLGTISTITIEYCQNMMNYSKNDEAKSRQIVPAGTIEVKYINDKYYDITAINIVSVDDKQIIEPKLEEIQTLDKAALKKRYRQLRKSGKNTHDKGGGIGLYEIAKVSDSIEYNFISLNEDKYIFTMKSIVKLKSTIKE